MEKRIVDRILIGGLVLLGLSSLGTKYLDNRGGYIFLNQEDFRQAIWIEVDNDGRLRDNFNEQKISHRKSNWEKYQVEVEKMNNGKDSDETILVPYFV